MSDSAYESEVDDEATPVGSGDWVIKSGDGMSFIAEETGFFWKTLWELPANKALRDARDDPDVLLPGDRVTVPDLRQKDETRSVDLIHTFRRKGVPSIVRVFVLDDDSDAMANLPYILKVGRRRYEGVTGNDGLIEHWVTPSARTGLLTVYANPEKTSIYREWEIALGQLQPENSYEGLQSRLLNLGYDVGPLDGHFGPRSVAALRDFQADMGLAQTGEADADTQDALAKAYGNETE